MDGIPTLALDYVREQATAIMQGVCKIERVHKPSFDQTTGTATSGSRTEVYRGPCRIWEASSGGLVMVGEDEVQMENTQLSIPWATDPVPKRYDEVEIISHNTDSSLVGRRFQILTSAKAGELRATRRFSVRGYQ